MVSFVKKIFEGRIDDSVHKQFVRFGKGTYGGRAVAVYWKTGKIKLSGSSDYAQDFALFAAEFGGNFSGIVLSREPIEGLYGKKKSGLLEYTFTGDANKVREVSKKAYAILLDCEGEIVLKMKKKLPKPGKSGEGKVDDKFCTMEIGLEHENKAKEWFFWDGDGKKMRTSHVYHIEEIIIPRDVKEPELMRLNSKRKGKVVRTLDVDGNVSKSEKNFEA